MMRKILTMAAALAFLAGTVLLVGGCSHDNGHEGKGDSGEHPAGSEHPADGEHPSGSEHPG